MFNLEVFMDQLDREVQAGELSVETKKYYVSALDGLNRVCGRQEENKSTAQTLEAAVYELCAGTHQAGKYVAAIKKYEWVVLQAPGTLLYGEPLARLRKQEVPICGKAPRHPAETYKKKINRMGNEKLKIAWRLQMQAGLRVAELASLTPEDLSLTKDGLVIRVRNGKGRKQRTVSVRQDKYLCEKLRELVENAGSGQPLFYKASYLIKKANEHDMETHDLRRINARARYDDARAGGAGIRASKRYVAGQLGHEKIGTTNLYLGGKSLEKREEESENK